MRPVTLTLKSSVGGATNLSLSQTVTSGPLLLNGSIVTAGVGTPTAPSYVAVTSGGNDSGITFTVAGTDANGAALSETFTGSNGGTAVSTHRFATITSITPSGAVATTVTAGTASYLYSEPCPVDFRIAPMNIGLAFETTSNATTFEVDYSLDDPWSFDSADAYNANGVWFAHASLVSMTANAAGSITVPVRAVRLKSNQAGTSVGTLRVIQVGGP